MAGRALQSVWLVVFVLVLGPSLGAAPATRPAGKAIVAVFKLSGTVTETPADESLALFSGPGVSLQELVGRMKKAAEDASVKAVVVLPEEVSLGPGQVEEIRQAMAFVRGEGKDVYVHADELSLGGYAMACAGSRVSVVPTGMLIIPGLHGESLHIRGLLDIIGVKPDFMTCGAYKSAAELFMRQEPSPESDQMHNWLFDSWYASFQEMIAKGRNVDVAKAKAWLDAGLYTAEKAKAAGLIDAVEHRQDFEAMLKSKYGPDVVFEKKYGQKQQQQLDFSSPFAVFKIWGDLLAGPQKKHAGKAAVGIVYVDGPIMVGHGQASPFGGGGIAFSTDVRKALDEAAKEDSVKAVVLRIDSPGGSAVASEIILNASKRLREKKPLVVSMGNIAGSGGYYVACGAETIFCDRTTLTGSIGVVTGKLATTEMWKKIGITFKAYKRGQNAGMLSSDDVFSESERQQMRAFMDEVYGTFKGHVTAIRGNKLKKPIDELAGGRVYTGQQALELGLVDRIGTLNDAIAFAAEQAKVKDYEVRVVPEPKNILQVLMEEMSGEGNQDEVRAAAEGDSLVRLAMPRLRGLDPKRTAAVVSALRRLEILRREGVALTMPEIGL